MKVHDIVDVEVFWLLCTLFYSVSCEPVYRRPVDLVISAVLTDVCDVNSNAEITATWQAPSPNISLYEVKYAKADNENGHTVVDDFRSEMITSLSNSSDQNTSYYKVRHKKTGNEDVRPVNRTTQTTIVIRDIPPVGIYTVSVSAVYQDGGRSEWTEATVSLSELEAKPVLTIDVDGTLAKWKHFKCDQPLFRIKERNSNSSEWKNVHVSDGVDGIDFKFEDRQSHQVCIDILINSRVYTQICQTMLPINMTSSNDEDNTAYVYAIVGVVGAIVVLVGMFGVVSYFMLCKHRGKSVPVASFTKQIYSSGRFGKRAVNYGENMSVHRKEHVPLNPIHRSPGGARVNEDNRLVVYDNLHRGQESPSISLDADYSSDKDD